MEGLKRKMVLASFDIGRKNFAQYVEECDVRTLYGLRERYRGLSRTEQRRVRGEMNGAVSDILEKVYLGGKRVHVGVHDLSGEADCLDTDSRRKLIGHLEKHRRLWEACDCFIIEQQFFAKIGPSGRRGARTEANIDAIKIAEGVVMWLMSNYPDKEVLYFQSAFKTQILGAPQLKERERKKWAVEKAREIFDLRGDEDASSLYDLSVAVRRKRMNSEEKIQGYLKEFLGRGKDVSDVAEKVVRRKQKLCDISDAVLQLQAFKYRALIAEF